MTGTDLTPQPATAPILNPATGEVLDLATEPSDVLARALVEVREAEVNLRAFVGHVKAEVLARMDAEGTWTVRAGGYKLTGDGPGRTEFDAPALWLALQALVEDGTITDGARDRAVSVAQTFTAHANGVKALRKLGGPVAEAIAAHERPVERPRAVRASRDAA